MSVNCGYGRSSCPRGDGRLRQHAVVDDAVEGVRHLLIELRSERHVLRIELIQAEAAFAEASTDRSRAFRRRRLPRTWPTAARAARSR